MMDDDLYMMANEADVITNAKLDILEAFTVILLKNKQHYLMLKRGASKSFAPGRWTGIGGRFETIAWA